MVVQIRDGRVVVVVTDVFQVVDLDQALVQIAGFLEIAQLGQDLGNHACGLSSTSVCFTSQGVGTRCGRGSGVWRGVDLVNHVVHLDDQPLNVLAIERSDERLVERLECPVGDLIASCSSA